MTTVKIRVLSEDHCESIQKKLFDMGYSWAGVYGEAYTRFLSSDWLFVSDKGIQMCYGEISAEQERHEGGYTEYTFEGGEFKLK